MKIYKLKYTGWRASDGVVFDSWDQHPAPVTDKDGKPVMGDDGKPKMGDPQPASFPGGAGAHDSRIRPGIYGHEGRAESGAFSSPGNWATERGACLIAGADHPGIPAKSDLVFDVELISMHGASCAGGSSSNPGSCGGFREELPSVRRSPLRPRRAVRLRERRATSGSSTPPPPPPAEHEIRRAGLSLLRPRRMVAPAWRPAVAAYRPAVARRTAPRLRRFRPAVLAPSRQFRVLR